MKKKLLYYNGAVLLLCILYVAYCTLKIYQQSQGYFYPVNGLLEYYSYKVCIMDGLLFLMVLLIPDILYFLYRLLRKVLRKV